jgi:hypothetical protein
MDSTLRQALIDALEIIVILDFDWTYSEDIKRIRKTLEEGEDEK